MLSTETCFGSKDTNRLRAKGWRKISHMNGDLENWSGCTDTGFPRSSVGKESACSAGDSGLIPGSGRSPGERPLQYFCLGNPHGQRSLAGYGPWGHKESDTTEWLTQLKAISKARYIYILWNVFSWNFQHAQKILITVQINPWRKVGDVFSCQDLGTRGTLDN